MSSINIKHNDVTFSQKDRRILAFTSMVDKFALDAQNITVIGKTYALNFERTVHRRFEAGNTYSLYRMVESYRSAFPQYSDIELMVIKDDI